MAALPRNAMRRLMQIAVEDEAYQRAALCITAQILPPMPEMGQKRRGPLAQAGNECPLCSKSGQ
jgi:hypothetical protein